MPEIMRAFDAADPFLIVGKRDVTTVPTQALFLMNSRFALAQADAMAKRLMQSKEGPPGKVTLAYRLALGREPTSSETAAVLKYLGDYRKTFEESKGKIKGNPIGAGWSSVCQMLFGTAEFRYVY